MWTFFTRNRWLDKMGEVLPHRLSAVHLFRGEGRGKGRDTCTQTHSNFFTNIELTSWCEVEMLSSFIWRGRARELGNRSFSIWRVGPWEQEVTPNWIPGCVGRPPPRVDYLPLAIRPKKTKKMREISHFEDLDLSERLKNFRRLHIAKTM